MSKRVERWNKAWAVEVRYGDYWGMQCIFPKRKDAYEKLRFYREIRPSTYRKSDYRVRKYVPEAK